MTDVPREAGLTLVSSNRLEALADALIERLRAPVHAEDVLSPRTIVVPHMGMGQWLEQRIARRIGIAANLRFALPAQFIWDVIGATTPAARGRSPLERDALPWRVLARFDRAVEDGSEHLAPLRDFLARASSARRWQLARRLGVLFDRYLVFRPDWIASWDRGGALGADRARWQPALWRALTDGHARPHRARLLQAHAQHLRDGAVDADALPRRAELFAIATLPPAELAWFTALARHAALTVYLPAPTREWWADTTDARTAARRALDRAQQRGEVDELLQEPLHPLLDEWGAVGRDFQALLYDAEAPATEDDRFVEPGGDTLLARIQRSVLDAEPLLVAGERRDDDRSIALHRCHGPLREVEALHDALLYAFAADPTLTPRDVVVLCADIARYAPLVDGVFGAAPAERRIAFHLADRGARATQPLLAALLRVFDLPGARFTASDVLSWWDEPAIRARFDVDEAARERIERWLADAGAHWGEDADARAAAGGAAQPIGTLRHAITRLLVGYALGEGGERIGLVAPQPDIEGNDAAVVGQFVVLLDTLASLRDDVARDRTAEAWRRFLLDAFDRLVADDDVDAGAARGTLRHALADLVDAARDADLDAPITSDVIRDWLARALDDDDRRTPWLSGSVCVCGMVPLRSVPFRVVCVLGLDDDAFPRRETADGLDLTRRAPRAGDRALRDDDRYLFLEVLLAARDHLHLSWSGHDARDGAARAPSPLVGTLLQWLRDDAFGGDESAMHRALVHDHPLAPWSPAAFAGAAPSFASEWLPRPIRAPAPFRTPMPASLDDATDVTLAELRAWLRHPAAYALTLADARRFDDVLARDDDVLETDALARHRALATIVSAHFHGQGGDIDTLALDLAARDEAPVGASGRLLAARLAASGACAAGWLRAHDAPPDIAGVREVDLDIDGMRLRGRVPVNANGDCVEVRAALRWSAIIRRHVEWLALRASGIEARLLVAACDAKDASGLWTFAPPDDPRAALAPWLALLCRARRELPAWLPQSSSEAALVLARGGDDAQALAAARRRWQGDRILAGEGEDPAWEIVARGWQPVEDAEFLPLAVSTFVAPIAALVRLA